MKGPGRVMVTLLMLWIFACLQHALSHRLSIFGATPNFLLVATACLGLLYRRSGGAAIGFAVGVIQGGLAGANMAQYIIARTIAGFGVGWFTDLRYQPSAALAGTVAGIVTLGSEFLLLLIAPPAQILSFVGATMGAAMYNGVLAMPVYALLSKIIEPPKG